jgi:hypothetical protein
MDRFSTSRKSRDLLSMPWSCLLLFCVPAIAIAITGTSVFGTAVRTVVWTGALTVLGIACSINAAGCGRVHCYITGPFFLLMAVVALLYGLGALPLGDHGWSLIGLIVLAGAVASCWLLELIFGKYRRGRAESSNRP